MIRKGLIVILMLCSLFYGFRIYGKDEPSKKIRRFAMIVGANDGGSSRVKLRYAVSDAASVMNVLKKMGGVNDEDSLILYEPDRTNFISAMKSINNKITDAKSESNRVELIFYFSGHSDEKGILLSGEMISYKEIRDAIKMIPADVKIAILDSCSSGAFTRIKGGKMKSPFLLDSSYDMKGYAFMTSSSSNEASQESDAIKGSFFTHYLVSGLRGAADSIQDGRITLNEAYQFAYNETLARTTTTLSGPQHPNYNIQMSGTGDVIITDIRKSSVGLIINKNLSGRFYIYNKNNILAAELQKAYGRDMHLGLESGSYRIINERDGKVFESTINLKIGSKFILSNNSFKVVQKEDTQSRGDKDEKKYVFNIDKDSIKNTVRNIGIFGGTDIKSAFFRGGPDLMIGSQAGVIYKNVAIGGGGYGLIGNLKNKGFINSGREYIGYGGLILGYYLFPEKMIYMSSDVLIGVGGIVNNAKWEKKFNNINPGKFFILEPEIKVNVSLFKYVQIGCGVSYRFVSGLRLRGITSNDFGGFSIGASIQYRFKR